MLTLFLKGFYFRLWSGDGNPHRSESTDVIVIYLNEKVCFNNNKKGHFIFVIEFF